MITKRVLVTHVVDVTVDETKFTPEFFASFNECFHYLGDDVDGHLRHLGQLFARAIINGYPSDFIEGYGLAKDMGIAFDEIDVTTEIEEG